MNITFSPLFSLGKADPLLFGQFLEHFQRQVYGGVFDPSSPFADEDGFRTDVIAALRKIRTPIIRWPGGCYVSAYNWHTGTGQNRAPTYDKAWRVEEPNTFGTDEYIKLCRKIGCEPYICTNAGTGSAEAMSSWVEYCNLKDMGRFARERISNGSPEPHNVRYWSIGNENWGWHEIGSKDAEEWSRFVRESAKMMLRVDPTLQLSAASIDNLDWNISLLREAGLYLDWISIHGYWDFTPDGVAFEDYDTSILHTGEDISGNIDRVRAYLTAYGLEKSVRIAFDEWNLRGWYHPNVMDIWNRAPKRAEDELFYKNEVIAPRDLADNNSIYTMADAVFSASFLNTCLRNCDIVGMACFSPAVNTRGAIYTYPGGIVLRPQYYVFDMYANLLKENVLRVWSDDVPTITGKVAGADGDPDVWTRHSPSVLAAGRRSVRTVEAVDAVVTCGDGIFAIAAVNKSRTEEQMLNLRALDACLREMRIHTLNGPSADAYNDVGRTEVSVNTSAWMPCTGSISLPPHSVSVIELR